MNTYIIATVVILILLVIYAYVSYNYVGWQPFTFSTNESASWQAKGTPADISRLRYRKVVFTLNVGGTTYTKDVTAVLNGMSTAYKGQANNGGELHLDTPLNAFSFTLSGVNSDDVVPDSSTPQWRAATVSLVGSSKTL